MASIDSGCNQILGFQLIAMRDGQDRDGFKETMKGYG